MSVQPHLPQSHAHPVRRGHLTGLPPQPRRVERPEPFAVEIRPAREQVIVAPRGELDFATAERVEAEIDRLAEAGFDQIVLDLRGLSFMDSTGVWLVLAQVRRPDATVRLVDGAASVARVFDLTGVRPELPFLAPDEVLRLHV
jgi:anti-sigma B factor antagonist